MWETGWWHGRRIAEMGVDMPVFPDAAHCASWAKLCPGSHESAGKQMNSKTGHGNRYLRRALLQAARLLLTPRTLTCVVCSIGPRLSEGGAKPS
jgi:transposase